MKDAAFHSIFSIDRIPLGLFHPHSASDVRAEYHTFRGAEGLAVALEVVGKLGRVTADITPGHLGEVLVEVRQGTERFPARAADSEATIRKHTRVLVVASLGGRTIEVAPTDSMRLPR